jgi:hypothetical protein
MESGIFLIIIIVWGAKVTYHCFRYKNAYWAVPTVVGFRDRKRPMDSKGIYRLYGFWTGLLTFIVFGYTCYYFWQVIN